MSGLSCGEICHLFCCPPCPSRIASKLAFVPPDSTYQIIPQENQNILQLKLKEHAEWQYSNKELKNIEILTTRTKRGVQIACMYVKYPGNGPKSKYTLLFSHGNAVDLGQMSSFYVGLSARLAVDIFSYDYCGYGASGGQPTEKNIYADIEAAYTILMHRYSVHSENIILYGQSIGTVPTIDLARKHDCAALVLHSPLMSGMRVAFPNTKRTWFFDAFPNIEKVSKVKVPVLVIHGTEDEVVDFSHGVGIFKQCPQTVEPLWVEGAGHNDIELHPEYVERLRKFVYVELPH